jgi:hypothetical protein
MVSERQWERVQSYIRRGVEEGARIVADGPGRPEGLADGYFVRPTLFTGVTSDMAIALTCVTAAPVDEPTPRRVITAVPRGPELAPVDQGGSSSGTPYGLGAVESN